MAEVNLQELLAKAQRAHAAGRLPEAESCYRAILAHVPRDPVATHLLGLVAWQSGRREEATALLADSVARQPDNGAFHFNYGNVLLQEGKLAGAIAAFRRLLELRPNSPEVLNNLGVALARHGQFADAAIVCRLALAQRPSWSEAAMNLAQALRGLGEVAFNTAKYKEAAENFRQAINIFPRHFESRLGLAKALMALNDPGAEAALSQAHELDPASAEVHYLIGRWFERIGKRDEAILSLRKAVALDANHVAAHVDLSLVLVERGRASESIPLSRRALELDPNNSAAAVNLGAALSIVGRPEEAAQVLLGLLDRAMAYQEAEEDELDNPIVRAARRNLHAALSNLLLMRHYDDAFDPDAVFKEHLLFGKHFDRPRKLDGSRDFSPQRKLRIGYVSHDFRRHSVAFFIEPVIEHHDRSAFEVFLYSANARSDALTERLKRYPVQWRQIETMSDEQAVDLVRKDRIDILVDLSGHTSGNRLPLFGMRPAPVQVTYLGYPDTTGLRAIDYRLTDEIVDPPGQTDQWHTEALVRLPAPAWCYRPYEKSPEVAPPPSIEKKHPTFGCFNALRKITPTTVRMWSQILKQVPGSRLILKARELRDEETRARVLSMLKDHDIDPNLVELRGPNPVMEEHLANYHDVDIALDPYPYHGTTTTCDALWMGVPVVTLAGKTHHSRVGASLLSAVNLGELVVQSPERYVEVAVNLARDAAKLRQLRGTLRDRVDSSPLRDEVGFARKLESAYHDMWRRRCASAVSAV